MHWALVFPMRWRSSVCTQFLVAYPKFTLSNPALRANLISNFPTKLTHVVHKLPKIEGKGRLFSPAILTIVVKTPECTTVHLSNRGVGCMATLLLLMTLCTRQTKSVPNTHFIWLHCNIYSNRSAWNWFLSPYVPSLSIIVVCSDVYVHNSSSCHL